MVNDPEFAKKLIDTMGTLDPICKLINRCQHPSVNIAEGTELWLSLELQGHQFDEEVQERLDVAISDVGFAANLMHPAYKGAKFDADGDQRTYALQFLNSHLNDDGKTELTTYLEQRELYDAYAKHYTNVFNFWVHMKWTFPNLSALCQMIMTIPASTAALEGLFSQATYIINKWRNKLSNASADRLIDFYHTSRHIREGKWLATVDKRNREYIDLEEAVFLEEETESDEFTDEEQNTEED